MGAPRDLHGDLPDHAWDILRKQTELYARQQVHRLRWRGDPRGVLPQGFQPTSIAAEAFRKLLTPPATAASVTWTIHPLAAADPPIPRFNQELRRLVRMEIDRLRHLKETSVLRNGPDLRRLRVDEGCWIHPMEALHAPDPTPLEALLLAESEAAFQRFQLAFNAFLGKERRLKSLFRLLCADTWKPADLAKQLKLSSRTVLNLRQRLQRRFAAFLKAQTSAQIQFSPKTSPKYFPAHQLLTRPPKKIVTPDAKFSFLDSFIL